MRSYFGTTVKEIGSLGVGMYLYFWVIRIVAIVFLCCSLLAIPAMVLNHEVTMDSRVCVADKACYNPGRGRGRGCSRVLSSVRSWPHILKETERCPTSPARQRILVNYSFQMPQGRVQREANYFKMVWCVETAMIFGRAILWHNLGWDPITRHPHISRGLNSKGATRRRLHGKLSDWL